MKAFIAFNQAETETFNGPGTAERDALCVRACDEAYRLAYTHWVPISVTLADGTIIFTINPNLESEHQT